MMNSHQTFDPTIDFSTEEQMRLLVTKSLNRTPEE